MSKTHLTRRAPLVIIALLTAATLTLAHEARAQEGPEGVQPVTCDPAGAPLTASEHLRALSLDLRGELPSAEERAAARAAGEVTEALLDDMLSSDAFARRFVRLHRALLWPYLGNSDTTPGYRLSYDAHWDPNGARTRLWYFPRPALRGDDRPCRNEPEPSPDAPVMVDEGGGKRREGYVCVRRYLDHSFLASDPDCPAGQIKVCAQDALTHPVSRATGDRCDVIQSRYSPPPEGCGCGENLRWCGDYQQFMQPLLDGLDQQIRWVIDNDRPYYELLAEAPPMINGPLAHYYKYMAPFMRLSLPLAPSLVPELEYRDAETWVEIDAGPEARGVLTNWVFLARFITQRARVDRFYQSFLCSPFEPPVSGIETNGADRDEPDLQRRDGCKYCHSIIEPIGAYWGRYAEGASAYLSPGEFPDFDPDCYTCALSGSCTPRCSTYYITQAPTGAEVPYLGYLKAYLFRYPEHQPHLNEGPRALVRRALLDGRLGVCATRNAFKWLVGRAPSPDEEGWVAEVAGRFMEGGYDFKSLVRELVMSDVYRRAR